MQKYGIQETAFWNNKTENVKKVKSLQVSNQL